MDELHYFGDGIDETEYGAEPDGEYVRLAIGMAGNAFSTLMNVEEARRLSRILAMVADEVEAKAAAKG